MLNGLSRCVGLTELPVKPGKKESFRETAAKKAPRGKKHGHLKTTLVLQRIQEITFLNAL